MTDWHDMKIAPAGRIILLDVECETERRTLVCQNIGTVTVPVWWSTYGVVSGWAPINSDWRRNGWRHLPRKPANGQ